MSFKPWITFQDKLQYQFRNVSNLEEALTHKSFAHERSKDRNLFSHNERLEFIGDAVLDLAISRMLMMNSLDSSEGLLSKRRASLVNEETLAEIARELDLQNHVILGRGERLSLGREKDSILSSALEAVFGALFLDGGFDVAYDLAQRLFENKISEIDQVVPFAKDFKSRLQEHVQAKHKVAPRYKIEKTEGPEHAKTFHVVVTVGANPLGSGVGKSRKEAEQKAAQRVLEELGI